MDSFYLLNVKDEPILEHNWTGRSLRGVVDAFVLEKARFHRLRQCLPPVVEVQNCLAFHVVSGSITFVCITSTDLDPAFVLELLHRIQFIFLQYFGAASATTELLANNFDTVTELLCEVIDNGSVLTTEANGVRDIVLPPSLLNKLMNVTGMQSKIEGSAQLSSIPWRRAKVKYTNNEIFVDVHEELTAIVDCSGKFVMTSVNGTVHCTTKLSGTPEVIVTLRPSSILGLPSFHPSVNTEKYELNAGTLSFIPPDGPFELMTYTTELSTNASSPLPFSLQILPGRTVDSFELSLSTRSDSPETLVIEIPLPASCNGVNLASSKGEHSITRDRDADSPLLVKWVVGSTKTKSATSSKASLSFTNVPTEFPGIPYARLMASMTGTAVSGLKVDSLKMQRAGEWKPYKGVKYMTKVDMIFRAK